MIDFPPNPIDGETYLDPNGNTWVFDVNMWTKQFKNLVSFVLHLDQVNDVEIGTTGRTGNEYLKWDGAFWSASGWEPLPTNEKVFVWDNADNYHINPSRQNQILEETYVIEYDQLKHGTFDTVNYRYNVTESGYYMIRPRWGHHNFWVNSEVSISIYKNGNPYIQLHRITGFNSSVKEVVNKETLVYLKDGEWLECRIIHTDGSGADISVFQNDPEEWYSFTATLIEATTTLPSRYLVGQYTTIRVSGTKTLSLEAGTYEVIPLMQGIEHVEDPDENDRMCLHYYEAGGGWQYSWDMHIISSDHGTVQYTHSGVSGTDWANGWQALLYRINNDPHPTFTITSTQNVTFGNGRAGWLNISWARTGNSWALYKIA